MGKTLLDLVAYKHIARVECLANVMFVNILGKCLVNLLRMIK